jgi:DMSO/TMAO reductase YedYZ molybdopterin-dependent catalytic subunit
MSPISRGFRGHRPLVDGARVPPGQHVVDEFPVLSVGSTPHMPLDAWTFGITGAIDEPVSWKWEELRALPAETPTVDIHCVTAWSRDAVVPSRSPEVQVVLLRIDDDHGVANSTSELR